MKVIVENHVPYIKGLLEPFATVEYLPYCDITANAVADADALIIRTRTRCDAALLDGSRCKFIGSATIGTDHIDIEYCQSHGIAVHNAPGCNAPAVAQYVVSTIGHLMRRDNITSPSSLTVGIIGVGHVGSIIARWTNRIGFKVLLNDPPRHRAETDFDSVPLEEIAQKADIITFHTPFTKVGDDATWHLCDDKFVNNLKHCRLLINSARGPITDTQALLKGLETGAIGNVAIDCWENEPGINLKLLDKAFVATPHIAGYSQEGKMRGTAMIVDAMNKHFGISANVPVIAAPANGAMNVTLDGVINSYDPLADTAKLKANPAQFEELRNHYPLRCETQA